MKKIILIGAAPCVIADIEKVPGYGEFDFLAIGMDAVNKGKWPVKFMATYHPEDIPEAVRRRKKIGGNVDYKVVSHEAGPGIDIIEPYEAPSGSSALLATLFAIREGYELIILCGCPLNEAAYVCFQEGWTKMKGRLKGRVFSMSGWTREFLGDPPKTMKKSVALSARANNFLIILGGAPKAMGDLAGIADHDRFDFMLVGAGSAPTILIPRLSYHVSHENDFNAVIEARSRAGLNVDYATYSNNVYKLVQNHVPEMTGPTCARDCNPRYRGDDARNLHHFSGSSAMLGLKVGLRLGYQKIVMAGTPMDEDHYTAFQRGWDWISDLLKRCPVRGMSGHPEKLLGRYTEEWLNG